MYMFVHIRKVFPKNGFVTDHFFFGKLYLWLEKYEGILVQFGDWCPCSCHYCNCSITQPVATRFCHVVHCLIENLPCIIMLMTYVLVFHLKLACNTRFRSSVWNQQLQVHLKHFFFHKKEEKVWLLSAIIDDHFSKTLSDPYTRNDRSLIWRVI